MTANSTATRKAKGRKLQQFVAKLIQDTFGLSELDVRSTSMGAQGVDVQLSSKALTYFPYAVECKCVEKVNIWEALVQASANAVEESNKTGLTIQPLVVVKKSHKEPVVILQLSAFMKLAGGTSDQET
jgi:hypothetical protein